MDIATVNDITLEYELVGSGEPVLLISPVLADGFRPLLSQPALADYQLIPYHKRGWVGSTNSPGPVTIEDHADDAAALLDHLGMRSAHIAGHSSGAAVAAQLAIDHPDRVRTLVLLEMSLLSVPAGESFFQQAGPAFAAYGSGDHEEALTRFMDLVSGLDTSTWAALLEENLPGSMAQALKDVATFFGIELPALAEWGFSAKDAALVDQPVLSVLGRQTQPLWVEVAAFLRASLPDVEERTIDGVGHLLHIQRPEPVARAMADFYRRHPMSGR